jgi:salicylate hydroxylase
MALGLEAGLKPHVVVPEELTIRSARSGAVLARATLGASAAQRYGAPFWVVHRGDLQAALCDAVAATPDIELKLGVRVDDFVVHGNGMTIAAARGARSHEEHGAALVAADGLWSALRRRLGHATQPRFAGHTAWRALVPAEAAPPALTAPAVNLWLGSHAHLVHYPIKGGRVINVVAIMRDDWQAPGWSGLSSGIEVLGLFAAGAWHPTVRELLGAAEHWQKWALADCAPLSRWGKGPATLLGDAAHPMLPYLAQGAAMAIEDAAVLGTCLARAPDDMAGAFRAYERIRIPRATRTQRAARRNSSAYHMGGVQAFVRTLALRAMGGERLIRSYDWLYEWEAP